MFTEHFSENGPIRLHYAVGGASGPPLLFLHGITRLWQDCLPLAPALLTRWRVHAFDFRGHGRSARTPGAYRLPDYLDDATAFLGAHVHEPAVVYGHSLGALVGIALAARAPDAVRALVLEDPPSFSLVPHIGRTPFHAMFAGLARFAGDRRPTAEVVRGVAEIRIPTGEEGGTRFGDIRDATTVRFTARCLRELDPGVFPPLLEGRLLEGCDLAAAAARVACPTLLLRGDDALGGMLSRRHAEETASAMPDCTLVHMAGVGHLIHWLQAEATLRHVIGFLESL